MKIRKTIYAIDLLFCLIVAIFTLHYTYVRYPWELWIAPLILLVRANVNVVLYRHEKKSIWGVLLFTLLFIVFVNSPLRIAAEKLIEIPVNVFASDEQLRHFYEANWLSSSHADMLKLLIYGWFCIFPIVSLIFQMLKKSLSINNVTWLEALFSYLFIDRIGKKHLPMAVLIEVSALVGISMWQSWFSLKVLPSLGYFILNRGLHRKAHFIEYLVLIIAMEILFESQYVTNGGKIALMLLSALIVGCLCFRLYVKTRRIIPSLLTFLICGFVIPVLTLGYNIYTGINTSRGVRYSDNYITSGILFISKGDNYGLRDRYRVILQPNYKEYNLIDSKNHLLQLTDDNGSIVYDVVSGMTTKSEIFKYGIRRVSYNDSTREETFISSNNDYIYTKMGFAPLNEKIVIENSLRKPLVYAGTASESGEYNFIKYLYGNDGKLLGLLRFPRIHDNGIMPYEDEIFKLEDALSSKNFMDEASLYKLVFDTDWKDLCFTRFIFKYNPKGQIIKVYDPLTDEQINAPENGHVEYLVKEADNFWESDLDGGQMELVFEIVSDNPTDKIYYHGYERLSGK